MPSRQALHMQRRKARGLCVTCGAVRDGKSVCECIACQEKRRDRYHKTYAVKRKEPGPLNDDHSNPPQILRKSLTAQRKSLGLCIRCGSTRGNSKNFCDSCLDCHSAKTRQQRGYKAWVPGNKGRPPLARLTSPASVVSFAMAPDPGMALAQGLHRGPGVSQ
jgi:hypothetical protein